jgi:thioredoxin-like negative regulator of GroEL
MLFVLAMCLNVSPVIGYSDITAQDKEAKKPLSGVSAAKKAAMKKEAMEALSLRVIELTSKNFGTSMGDGNVWLIEFYTPWCVRILLRVLYLASADENSFGKRVSTAVLFPRRCKYCQTFQSSYQNIAASFHSSPNEKIRVAKVDCTSEKALKTRFGLQSFPSFYIVDGWSVYQFENVRTESSLMDFARGGYKKQDVSVH